MEALKELSKMVGTQPEEANKFVLHLFLFLILTDPSFVGLQPLCFFPVWDLLPQTSHVFLRSLRLEGPGRTERCRMPRSELVSLEGALNQFSLILPFKARAPTKH